jgi:hypothetical protein
MHSFHTDSRLFRDALERLGEASSAPADGQGPEAGEAGAGIDFVSDRREVAPPRVIGRLVALNGTQGVISCPLDTSEEDWSVGHLITIVHKAARLVGAVCDVETHDGRWSATEVNTARVTVELNGEIVDDSSGAPYFHRGVSSFPSLGAAAHRIRADDLRAIYAFRGREGVEIGRLSQNQAIPAEIDVGELIRRHFAVLGSTGVGKTTSVSLLLRKSVAMRPKLRVIIFDPHNEYAAHFPGLAQIIDSDSLELPFWMFRFDELADVVFSGRLPHADERDALYEVIRAAKAKYLVELGSPAATSAVRRQPMSEGVSVTADTPTPFRIIDVVAVIEDWLGMLDQRFPRSDLRALRYGSRGSTAIRGFGSCLAGWWSRTISPRSSRASFAYPLEACQSPSSSLRACPTRSSTRSSRCSRGWRSKSHSGARGRMKSTCYAKRRTAIFQPTAGKPSGRPGRR